MLTKPQIENAIELIKRDLYPNEASIDVLTLCHMALRLLEVREAAEYMLGGHLSGICGKNILQIINRPQGKE